ncbi:FadR/GntR family transcriptional regulator [Mesorhizobium yinganensis]|uniref:FadR/GntR family transcriptional regulator n=1 Tax=Mesorhizobium yinganensis TaxID=3157707 RepID=UPI0032B7BDA0
MFARVLVPQSAARKIQAMILSGKLKAGEKIPSQRELSLTLKISRASLREALLTLETLGLLDTQPGKGTFVAEGPPSASRNMARWRYAERYPVADVFATRFMLEGTICALAAATLPASDFETLERATDDMERFWASGDLLSNVEADLEFHSVIASGCQNIMLVDLYRSVRDLITETQRQPIPITAPARMSQSIAEHRLILDALRKRDGQAARHAMENHVLNTARCANIDL